MLPPHPHPESLETPVDPHDAPPPVVHYPPMPMSWRVIICAVIVVIGYAAYLLRDKVGTHGQSIAGVIFFFGIVAAFSSNLRAVSWWTIGWGIALQVVLALLVLTSGNLYYVTAVVCFIAIMAGLFWIHIRPVLSGEPARLPGIVGGVVIIAVAYWIFFAKGVRGTFDTAGDVVKSFINFSDKGAEFVFGNLARPGDMAKVFGSDFIFCFAFKALPPILFVSAFFTVLYHFGILQKCVRMLAVVMVHLMGTSGAETLSVAANVFMGQTEAPLIVKPYVPRMTNSELFALMASGMAHISGGMMVVYISYGANPVAVLTTCVMACPCSLYLSKLFLPEVSKPETGGTVQMKQDKSPYVNAIDAAATGTSDGLQLALNVGAMLIVFIAFVAMFDGVLGLIDTQWLASRGWWPSAWALPEHLSLQWVFGQMFAPIAFLMGVTVEDTEKVGSLLGSKLAINEHYAYLQMRQLLPTVDPTTHEILKPGAISERSLQLAAFALTGFANFSSVGIQLGGIGAIAPNRRSDLARLGMRALFVGFTATLLNASIAGLLLETHVQASTTTLAPAEGVHAAPADSPTAKPTTEGQEGASTDSKTAPSETAPAEPAKAGQANKESFWQAPQIKRSPIAADIRNRDYFVSVDFARERYRQPTMYAI